MKDDILKLRKDYTKNRLEAGDLNHDPVKQFRNWLNQAIESKVEEPTAMTLATATKEGIPSARIVLLKKVDEKGFVFFTNYESRKSKELLNNPNAALVFFWSELERQVRVEGKIKQSTPEESAEYFLSRPYESRVSAVISPQSSEIPGRDFLEQKFEENLQKYNEQTLQRPPYWGGFVLKPYRIEFWQGRESRLHDRFVYQKNGDDWRISRLAP